MKFLLAIINHKYVIGIWYTHTEKRERESSLKILKIDIILVFYYKYWYNII